MHVKQEEIDAIQSALRTLYFYGRDAGDAYVMETCDNILAYMQKIEKDNIKRKQALISHLQSQI